MAGLMRFRRHGVGLPWLCLALAEATSDSKARIKPWAAELVWYGVEGSTFTTSPVSSKVVSLMVW